MHSSIMRCVSACLCVAVCADIVPLHCLVIIVLQLPISYKVGALSWLCSEFLKLDSIRYVALCSCQYTYEVRLRGFIQSL